MRATRGKTGEARRFRMEDRAANAKQRRPASSVGKVGAKASATMPSSVQAMLRVASMAAACDRYKADEGLQQRSCDIEDERQKTDLPEA